MRKRIIFVAAVVGFIAAGAGQLPAEDEKGANVETTIQKALADYKAGKVNDAISGLQTAIVEMQKSQQKGMAAFFPKAPEGWEAGEVKSDSIAIGGSGNWIMVKRAYKKKDENSAEVSMTNSPSLVDPQKQLAEAYKDAKMIEAMNANPDVKFTAINKDGWIGWSVITKDSDAQASLISGGTWILVNVRKGDAKVINDFINGIDLKGLAAAQSVQVAPPAK